MVLSIVDLRQQCVISYCAEISADGHVYSNIVHVYNSIEMDCQLERSRENPAHADCRNMFDVQQGFCFSYMRELAMGLVTPSLTSCIRCFSMGDVGGANLQPTTANNRSSAIDEKPRAPYPQVSKYMPKTVSSRPEVLVAFAMGCTGLIWTDVVICSLVMVFGKPEHQTQDKNNW